MHLPTNQNLCSLLSQLHYSSSPALIEFQVICRMQLCSQRKEKDGPRMTKSRQSKPFHICKTCLCCLFVQVDLFNFYPAFLLVDSTFQLKVTRLTSLQWEIFKCTILKKKWITEASQLVISNVAWGNLLTQASALSNLQPLGLSNLRGDLKDRKSHGRAEGESGLLMDNIPWEKSLIPLTLSSFASHTSF